MNHIPDHESLEVELRRQFTKDEAIQLVDTPNFPLAFQVALPAGFAGTHGNIGIQFEAFSICGLDGLTVGSTKRSDEGSRLTADVHLGQLSVTGRYRVTAKATPRITLDTGGGMMDLDNEEIGAAGAPSAVSPLDPDKRDEMLKRAREQRDHLRNTEGGARLLAQYDQHNEIYNEVFVTSEAARTAWAANGATKEMAEHTHGALDPAAMNVVAVNPQGGEKTFGQNTVTYNANAFLQQLNIAVHAASLDPNFDPYDEKAVPDPNSPYIKASLAALTFGNAVDNTNNSKEKVSSMNAKQVYAAVAEAPPPRSATMDELQNMLAQGMKNGGGAAAVAATNHWRVLDEDDRRLVRGQIFAITREKSERAVVKTETVWTGMCHAEFSAASTRLEYILDDGRLQFNSASVVLPAFGLNIDDSQWQGTMATLVRERLSEMAFVRHLLRERIETGIADRLTSAAAEAAQRASQERR